ncbi:DUF2007 domain-containing protein [Oleiagrimonas sp. C23AA]|uniref:DUF2007 domain-containing protein n=1 Tax=Oleiagrimonas sp. C23AA TaxID=2719047 RepID=UPI001420AC67|nr:DUF2007 domain-containing protein [Oleiagrimonas sp. C23AA]NII11798.1 hypothetical protein [Oleiagrimonas sp. C23AA]
MAQDTTTPNVAQLSDQALLEQLRAGQLDEHAHQWVRREACRRGLVDDGLCDEDLLDGDVDDDPMDELVPLLRRFTPADARAVQQRLHAADIDAVIADAHLAHTNSLLFYATRGVRVLVPASQADAAMYVVRLFQASEDADDPASASATLSRGA